MATLEAISDALKLVEAKKQNLKEAYDDLQSHSSLLSSSSLSWSHIDSDFTSIQNSLTQRFIFLQSLESRQQPPHTNPSSSSSKLSHSNPKDPNFSPFPNDPPSSSNSNAPNGTSALPKIHAEQLCALCKSMDGKGLRDYVGEHLRDKVVIRVELRSALKCASDAASMVLDSLDGVVGANAVRDDKVLRRMKKCCNLLFQQMRAVSTFVSSNARKKAKRLGAEWKVSLVNDNADAVGAMAFLHFVAAYGLLSELTMAELATFSAMAAANDELPELYRIIGLTDKVPGLIQKLLDKGKHILAVKYVFEFNLAGKIPPVPILKAHVNESQKLARRLSQEGKSLNEITAREIHALKSVIKVIENHNLESEYPRASLEQRIEQLTKQKINVKQAVPSFAAKPPQHQQLQGGIKRPRISAPVGPAAVMSNVNSASSSVHHYQQPTFQSPGLLLEHSNPCMNLPPMPYGMMAPTSTILPYRGSSTRPYGLDGVPMDPSGNLGQGCSLPNSSEQRALSGYYDSVPAYSGYGLQHCYQASYPQ